MENAVIYTYNDDSMPQQFLSVGSLFVVGNFQYTIQSLISSGTGEATVYKIADNAGKTFALKLYYEFRFGEDEPNGIALQRIRQLNDADILKLYDFGVGADKYLGKYCYEISEFAEGGNLLQVENFMQKYTADFIEKEIVPQIYLALIKLHEYKIYHCDLKPQNILYLDAAQTNLVIGDYGSAKAYDMQSEKDLRRSKIVKGTEAYLAPEQARGITSEKNDYYSFGMILLHLLYPGQLCDDGCFDVIDRDKFSHIVERQYNAEPIIEYKPKFERINDLIQGLTNAYQHERWGKNEVCEWINGKQISVIRNSACLQLGVHAIVINGQKLNNTVELADYIESSSNFHKECIRNQENSTAIKTFLIETSGIATKNKFLEIINCYSKYGERYVQLAQVFFLDVRRRVKIYHQEFDLWDDFNKIFETSKSIFEKIKSIQNKEERDNSFFRLELAFENLSNQQDLDLSDEIHKIYNSLFQMVESLKQFPFTPKTELGILCFEEFKQKEKQQKFLEKEILENDIFEKTGIEMVFVEAGNYRIGREEDNPEFMLTKNIMDVKLHAYYIGKYPVTVALWNRVMKNNQICNKNDMEPVVNVNIKAINTFINSLNNRLRMKFRLPSEWEWEVAARGGFCSNNFKYSGSNNIDDVAWYEANSDNKVHTVGQKKPNEMGIYDMSGNVSEICAGFYYNKSDNMKYIYCRGGNAFWGEHYCKVYEALCISENDASSWCGFRLAL